MFTDGSAETGSNAGSNFTIQNYSDSGSPLGAGTQALYINRATGAVTAGQGTFTAHNAVVGGTFQVNGVTTLLGAIAGNVQVTGSALITYGNYSQINSSGAEVGLGKVYGFGSTVSAGSSMSTQLSVPAPGIISADTTAAGNALGTLKAAALQIAGTTFTVSGCSAGTAVGGASAGRFSLGAVSCSVVITMNGATGLTATNGWSCKANDETTAAGNTLLYFSANSQTTATLSVPATAGTSDVIDFACTAF
jgi:hypothetical protein